MDLLGVVLQLTLLRCWTRRGQAMDVHLHGSYMEPKHQMLTPSLPQEDPTPFFKQHREQRAPQLLPLPSIPRHPSLLPSLRGVLLPVGRRRTDRLPLSQGSRQPSLPGGAGSVLRKHRANWHANARGADAAPALRIRTVAGTCRSSGKETPTRPAAPPTCKTTKYLQPRANTAETQRCHFSTPGQEHLVPATDSPITRVMPGPGLA